MRLPLRNIILVFGLLGVTGMGLLGYQSAQPRADPTPVAPATVPVSIGDVVQSVNAPGKLEASEEANLGMGVGGSLGDVLVRPGDMVHAGQLLATLGDGDELLQAVEDAKAELAAAQLALQDLLDNAPMVTAQAQLEEAKAQEALRQAEYRNLVLQEGNRASAETIAEAEAALVLAKLEVGRREAKYNAQSGKPEDHPARARAKLKLAEARKRLNHAIATLNWYLGHPTQIQQVILDAEVAIAEAHVAAAERRWERVKDGPDPYELGKAEARVSQAEVRLANAEADLAARELFAPFNGVILRVQAMAGDVVAPDAKFIFLINLHSLEVEVTVIEEDLPQVQVGQSVVLYFDARPDVEGEGVVERVVPQRLSGDRPLYAVYISIEDLPDGLAPGMTVDASIITALREDVLRLPKSLVRARSDGTAEVGIWENGSRHERTVRVGLRGDSYVEILAGLNEGDQVIGE
ncbi:MAG: efflux RND transporter periplasmic adaptor subunit [Anaerolineales bacterium]|nr:efflux RND transporter periplasmic adaptor subunit [Anaerolineales bacterium]